jgi:phosphatidylglycerol---prolipoprotein diacylglyceryl transferase
VDSLILASPGAVAFHLGPLTVRWYGILIGLGFLMATWAATFLCKRRGLDTDTVINGALASFVGGILGARLYFVALDWQSFANHPQDILAIWQGGLSIHGGIIGGIITAWIYCRLMKFDALLPGLDIAGCVLPLAQAIGRWGNFFNSEAYGQPVDDSFPIKLFIPPESRREPFLGESFFHPTFLYESIWNLAIFIVLYGFLFERLKNYPGMTFLAYLFLYSIGRSLIEPIRVDSIMVGGYAAPSVVSIALVVISALAMAGLFWFYKRRSKETKA